LIFGLLALVAIVAYIVLHLVPDLAGDDPTTPPTATAPSPTPSGATPTPTVADVDQPDRPALAVPDVRPPGFVDPPPGMGRARYERQTVAWRDCRVEEVAGLCAQVVVPLDWAAPDRQAITLAVFRRLGQSGDGSVIFVNPGGPGAGGRSLAALLHPPGLEAYDLVGWDPRGVGESTPVVCPGGAVLDGLLGLDASPDDDAEWRALLQARADFGRACWEMSGELLEHVSTADTVADLDLLRQLLVQDRLNYIGFSYGTYIGAMYADRFPQSVGHLVLDSAVDISDDDSVRQSAGFELTFDQYDAWCASSGCPAEVRKDSLTLWLDQLDQAPLAVGQRWLTQSLATIGVAQYLYYDQSAWPQLTEVLGRARAGDGAALLRAADRLWDRSPDGSYSGLLAGFTAVSCLDAPDRGVTSALRDWIRASQDAPLFGRLMGPDLDCVTWPVRAPLTPHLTGLGSAPIVVIGSTGDSATPYIHAVTMADQLQSAVLVTYDGPGHANYASGHSQCLNQVVRDYFLSDALPQPGTRCS
jgi:pimeloyl-ACP methyl ester carboxylesterase